MGMGIYSEGSTGGSRVLLRRHPSPASILVAVMVIPLLAGCSSNDQPASVSQPTSAKDAAERRISCLQDRGWDVSLTDDNAIAASVPNNQLNVYQQDLDECAEGIFPDKAAFTQDQWSEAYAAANETADCLAEEGYEVAERPSLQSFIESNGDWSVYFDLLDQGIITNADVSELEILCPQAEYWG